MAKFMETGYVKTKGKLIIPIKLRKKFGMKAGTMVRFYEEKDGIKIIPITSKTIKNNIGFLRKDGPNLLKALMEEKKVEREF
ncbi:MAG: AbrB/MazE/SpoVT family DNA-binding domain-containing protein [Ignavibacteriaceae bacterium]